jgi:signal transduction histidine kinase
LVIKRIKPAFWDHTDIAAGSHHLFNFRRKWMLLVALTSVVTLTPLVTMTWIDYRLTRTAIESEAMENTAELVSGAWRSVAYFLSERESAMQFVVRDNSLAELSQPDRLAAILVSLQKGLGGFLQLSVVAATGQVLTAAGQPPPPPDHLTAEAGFGETLRRGSFFYTVGQESGGGPNLVIGVTSEPESGDPFVLRAVVDQRHLHGFLSQLVLTPGDDAFIIDQAGHLVTPSRHPERVPTMTEQASASPDPTQVTQVIEVAGPGGDDYLLGYAYIPKTALILMLERPKTQMTRLWLQPRLRLIGLLVVNIVVILLAIIGMATYLVNHIHRADQRRIMNLHQAEYANKLAGIGRLAAGVAHEINNPLAVINEQIGMIKDLLTLQSDRPVDPRLVPLIDKAGDAVVRTTTVTRRLLNFARHMEAHVERFELGDMVEEVAGFLTKEAERRCVRVAISLPETPLVFEADRGNLQQILLNLFNNALEAMPDGGRLTVGADRLEGDLVRVIVADTGAGIPEEDLKRIFEPFFTTKTAESGTGLGLSVTYSLVQEIGGEIQVFSRVDEGTRFELVLPLVHAGEKPPEACPLV